MLQCSMLQSRIQVYYIVAFDRILPYQAFDFHSMFKKFCAHKNVQNVITTLFLRCVPTGLCISFRNNFFQLQVVNIFQLESLDKQKISRNTRFFIRNLNIIKYSNYRQY